MPTYQHQRFYQGEKGIPTAGLFRLARSKGWDGKPVTWGTSSETGNRLPVRDRKVHGAVMHLEDKGFGVLSLEGDLYSKKIHVKEKVRSKDNLFYYPVPPTEKDKNTRLKALRPPTKRTTRIKAAGDSTHTHSHSKQDRHKKPATRRPRSKKKNGFAGAEKKIRKWFS